jgi:uncharacterized protein YcfJ
MIPRLVLLVMALLSVAAPVAAQDSLDRSTISAVGATVATVRPPIPFGAVKFRASNDAVLTRVPQKRSKAPVVGGMLLGAIAGFLAGNYLQHSACEYECGPGGFTWGFTAIGAAGGAGIGLLLR